MTNKKTICPISDNADKSYHMHLDRRISDLASCHGVTLESVLRGARGAFPTLVIERLRFLGLYGNLRNQQAQNRTLDTSSVRSELHPLDFEWYFSPECARRLSEILLTRDAVVLCIGAPTVATALAQRGIRAILIERNPLVRQRFPNQLRHLQCILHDITEPLEINNSFPVVFFDAPWYPEYISLWLWQASQVAQPGGIIAFAVFPPLLRPSAKRERLHILEQASIIGRVEVLEEELTYETPLFEREALAASGTRLEFDWRIGDLVIIHVQRIPKIPPALTMKRHDKWESFLLDGQVVKLRKRRSERGGLAVAPLEGYPDYLFPSVSARDPRRKEIDLWTSRNRVAKVGRRDIVAKLLNHLAEGQDPGSLFNTFALSSNSSEDKIQMISRLYLALGLPIGG